MAEFEFKISCSDPAWSEEALHDFIVTYGYPPLTIISCAEQFDSVLGKNVFYIGFETSQIWIEPAKLLVTYLENCQYTGMAYGQNITIRNIENGEVVFNNKADSLWLNTI